MSIAMTLDAAGCMLSVSSVQLPGFCSGVMHEQNIHSNVSIYVSFCMHQ